MTGKKRFERLIDETIGYVCYSILYDEKEWRKDIDKIAIYLEVLDILKKKKVDIALLFISKDVDEYNEYNNPVLLFLKEIELDEILNQETVTRGWAKHVGGIK